MERTTHTPGPWVVGKTQAYFADEVYVGTKRIAQCSARGESTPETEANARLIAAAPELLASLTEILAMDVNGHSLASRLQFSTAGRDILIRAGNAVDKATGNQ